MGEGIAEAVLLAALYLAGVPVLLVVIAASKKRWIWLLVLVAYLVVPGTYLYVRFTSERAASDRVVGEDWPVPGLSVPIQEVFARD